MEETGRAAEGVRAPQYRVTRRAESVPPQGRYLEVNGIDLYYETYGEGEPLLLLHGFTGSGADWRESIAHYAASYRLIIPDLRGHGRSTNPSGTFTHREACRDLYGLLDHLGIERTDAIGISSGGMTLLHMATLAPRRIRAMVLVGATIYFPETARKKMRASTEETLTPQLMVQRRALCLLGDDQIRMLHAQFLAMDDTYDDMNFTMPYLSTIRARTLIVHGDRDEFFPVEIPFQMYRGIPDSYLWIVPNGSHGPHWEHPDEFRAITLSFLRGEFPARPKV